MPNRYTEWAQARKSEIDMESARFAHLNDTVTQLKSLVENGLPTTITKWVSFGSKLTKILSEEIAK